MRNKDWQEKEELSFAVTITFACIVIVLSIISLIFQFIMR